MDDIFEFVNDSKDKIENSVVFLNLETNRAIGWKEQKSWNFEGFDIFRERKCHFSLSSRAVDRRNSSGQEANLLYATRPTRGFRF